MHPSVHARTQPDKPAYIMAGSGEVVTYRELDERSNQAAQLFRSLGLKRGDVVAVCLENHARYLEIAWATQRTGLYIVCISSKLTGPEAEYIVRDCGAKVFITSIALKSLAEQIGPVLSDLAFFMVGGAVASWRSWEETCATMPTTPVSDESAGTDMLYSSGTTGRPKGIKAALPADPVDAPKILTQLVRKLYGLDSNAIYLSPAPLYHAAPLRWCMTVQQLGGTVIVMESFDPEMALALIEKYRISSAQWVPTHFVRLLRLPAQVRDRYDVSSLRFAIHAAAPCPVEVKQQMIDWWGPIVYEYYAGTEGNGMTTITAAEWLKKKGSVGRAAYGELKICDESGDPVGPRVEGAVYFGGTPPFEYHNAPDKTQESRNQHGWSTLGDIGYVDEDGYLFLTDRKAFMIISGGVNIYPQEIENLLITHPAVMDVAVVGAPDAEMGEKVVAVVQPVDFAAADAALAQELMTFARDRLSHVKVPRLIEFTRELPRHPNGKLYKRLLRDAYWGRQARIV
ncbi:long-chain acyl-CoA synthetase [Povalibacter uvarum]|uniref:Long-chain acyl-CoA synthetase n=1 Tax=Povalibacter uvarum TaxID=732238 RepID=A0A841HKT9_9GAMM|nr:acyl-CoA synthetase [Povalibacter uvarum]MBB6092625.1 long-chain acyl-CoA synthetase [Povalibacter uvarum]